MPTRGKTEKTHLLSQCRFPGDGYRGSGEVLQLKSTFSLASPPIAIRELPSIRPVWRTCAISSIVAIPSTCGVAVSKSSSRNTCQVGGNSLLLRCRCRKSAKVTFAISVRRRSDGTGRLFSRIFRVPFPYSLYVRVTICTSTSPRFCVFYICMNTFNTAKTERKWQNRQVFCTRMDVLWLKEEENHVFKFLNNFLLKIDIF